jgi:hypothetical protein
VTASTAAHRSAISAASTAACACVASAKSRPASRAWIAARAASSTTTAGACCVLGGANGADTGSGLATRCCARAVGGALPRPPGRALVRGVASPVSSGARRDGVDRVRDRDRVRIRPESVRAAASCAAMPGTACARHVSNAIPTGRSSEAPTSLHHCPIHQTGLVASSAMSRHVTARPARPR